MLLLLFSLPGGPDLCALAGVCPTTTSSSPNLLFAASALVLGGVILHRRNGDRKP